jgi:hypothetical protein
MSQFGKSRSDDHTFLVVFLAIVSSLAGDQIPYILQFSLSATAEDLRVQLAIAINNQRLSKPLPGRDAIWGLKTSVQDMGTLIQAPPLFNQSPPPPQLSCSMLGDYTLEVPFLKGFIILASFFVRVSR